MSNTSPVRAGGTNSASAPTPTSTTASAVLRPTANPPRARRKSCFSFGNICLIVGALAVSIPLYPSCLKLVKYSKGDPSQFPFLPEQERMMSSTTYCGDPNVGAIDYANPSVLTFYPTPKTFYWSEKIDFSFLWACNARGVTGLGSSGNPSFKESMLHWLSHHPDYTQVSQEWTHYHWRIDPDPETTACLHEQIRVCNTKGMQLEAPPIWWYALRDAGKILNRVGYAVSDWVTDPQ